MTSVNKEDSRKDWPKLGAAVFGSALFILSAFNTQTLISVQKVQVSQQRTLEAQQGLLANQQQILENQQKTLKSVKSTTDSAVAFIGGIVVLASVSSNAVKVLEYFDKKESSKKDSTK